MTGLLTLTVTCKSNRLSRKTQLATYPTQTKSTKVSTRETTLATLKEPALKDKSSKEDRQSQTWLDRKMKVNTTAHCLVAWALRTKIRKRPSKNKVTYLLVRKTLTRTTTSDTATLLRTLLTLWMTSKESCRWWQVTISICILERRQSTQSKGTTIQMCLHSPHLQIRTQSTSRMWGCQAISTIWSQTMTLI